MSRLLSSYVLFLSTFLSLFSQVLSSPAVSILDNNTLARVSFVPPKYVYPFSASALHLLLYWRNSFAEPGPSVSKTEAIKGWKTVRCHPLAILSERPKSIKHRSPEPKQPYGTNRQYGIKIWMLLRDSQFPKSNLFNAIISFGFLHLNWDFDWSDESPLQPIAILCHVQTAPLIPEVVRDWWSLRGRRGQAWPEDGF